MYRNKEGYADSTAGRAVREVARTEKKRKTDINSFIDALNNSASLIGLQIVEIKLKDRHSKKVFHICEELKK